MTPIRWIQILLILLATFFGYQLPSLNLSFPVAMLGVLGYALIAWSLLHWTDPQKRS